MTLNRSFRELEFHQVGDTWLHVRHVEPLHGVRLSIVNESDQSMAVAELTTAMARQLRDWLDGHFPI